MPWSEATERRVFADRVAHNPHPRVIPHPFNDHMNAFCAYCIWSKWFGGTVSRDRPTATENRAAAQAALDAHIQSDEHQRVLRLAKEGTK